MNEKNIGTPAGLQRIGEKKFLLLGDFIYLFVCCDLLCVYVCAGVLEECQLVTPSGAEQT